MGTNNSQLEQPLSPIQVENTPIPLWKYVDSNYYYEEGEVHKNGSLFTYEQSEFSLHASGATYDTYKREIDPEMVYSSLTYAAYLAFIPGLGAPPIRLQRVESFSNYHQTLISEGFLYVTVAASNFVHKLFFSPSDFTRIDSGSSLTLGISSGENVVPGAKYNNDLCIGYFVDEAHLSSLYNDNGEIKSPGYEDQTFTPSQCYFLFGSYTVDQDPKSQRDFSFGRRRILCSEEELSRCRNRKLSSMALSKIHFSGGPTPYVTSVKMLHPHEIVNTTMSWSDPRMIEVSFKSTPSGAYLKIRNNNSFDVFITSIEIWGLWGVRQSSTGDFGGAIVHTSYSEHHSADQSGASIDNEFVHNLEQAKDVADYYLDVGSNHGVRFNNIKTNIGTMLEIGDKFQINMEEFGEEGVRVVDVVVVAKTMKPDGVYVDAIIL